MIRMIFLAVSVISVISAALVWGQTTQDSTDRKADSEIRRLNAQEVDALLHNDTKALSILWSDDMVVTNPLNKLVTKQQVLGMVDSGLLAFTSYDRQIEYIHVYGNAAVVAGSETVVWAGKFPLAGKTSHLRFTGVWTKQAGRWQQVARHANIIPE